jgi:hypothetical protein
VCVPSHTPVGLEPQPGIFPLRHEPDALRSEREALHDQARRRGARRRSRRVRGRRAPGLSRERRVGSRGHLLAADRGAERGRPPLRGVAFGRAINLDTAAGAVAGLAGGEPLNLVVEREGRVIRLHGLVRGRLSSFRIDPGEAAGTLGACSYELARDGDRYEGRRSCGGGRTERAELRLADSLARWSDPDRAAALALLMGGAR